MKAMGNEKSSSEAETATFSWPPRSSSLQPLPEHLRSKLNTRPFPISKRLRPLPNSVVDARLLRQHFKHSPDIAPTIKQIQLNPPRVDFTRTKSECLESSIHLLPSIPQRSTKPSPRRKQNRMYPLQPVAEEEEPSPIDRTSFANLLTTALPPNLQPQFLRVRGNLTRTDLTVLKVALRKATEALEAGGTAEIVAQRFREALPRGFVASSRGGPELESVAREDLEEDLSEEEALISMDIHRVVRDVEEEGEEVIQGLERCVQNVVAGNRFFASDETALCE